MAGRLAKFGIVLAAIGAVVVLVLLIGRRPAEVASDTPTAAPQKIAQTSPPDPPFADPYQRSVAIYTFHKAAASGADRGREIFYYKCWFCHNEFADGAPKLKGVFQRKQLLSGRPANEDGIKDEIRNGGAGMAAYKYVLSDADLNDLVSYIRDQCCWDSKSPPPNPRYRGNAGD
jgi:mono/diheme cytochrome c family protein